MALGLGICAIVLAAWAIFAQMSALWWKYRHGKLAEDFPCQVGLLRDAAVADDAVKALRQECDALSLANQELTGTNCRLAEELRAVKSEMQSAEHIRQCYLKYRREKR